MNIDVFSICDKKYKDIVYVLLNSVKNARDKDDTVINYHLIVQDLDDSYKAYFKDLEDSSFNIFFYEARGYASKIHPMKNSYLYYIRCLAPSIFPLLDKILYLDVDTVFINSGLEQLWNIDLGTKFVGATIDIQIQYNSPGQRANVKKANSETYFNTGVMLLNLYQIRKENKDKKIEEYLLRWPRTIQCVSFDQTLLNYVFGDQVKIISTKWNNSVLSLLERDQKAYKEYYGTDNVIQKIKDAIIVHFKGPKPWQAVSANIEYMVLNRKLSQQIYGQVYKQLAKHQEF